MSSKRLFQITRQHESFYQGHRGHKINRRVKIFVNIISANSSNK